MRDQSGSRLGIRSSRDTVALALLWAAWLVGATALFVNHAIFRGSGVGPGLPSGVVSLAVYGAVLVGVARGVRYSRNLTLPFVVLSALPLPLLVRLYAEHSVWTAAYIAGVFILRTAGALLLFTGHAEDSRMLKA